MVRGVTVFYFCEENFIFLHGYDVDFVEESLVVPGNNSVAILLEVGCSDIFGFLADCGGVLTGGFVGNESGEGFTGLERASMFVRET